MSAATESVVRAGAHVPAQIEKVLVGGDLSQLSPQDRVLYYKAVCESVGLNPLTRPFDYLTLNNKLILYARKDCTDQLRSIHDISVTITARETTEGVYVVTSRATKATGRTDESIGAVPLENLRGEQKANALMKAETKAKRRVTLSICGLGMLDETEVDSIPDAQRVEFSAPVGKPVDIGPNKMNTQAAANYVRDQKLAAIEKDAIEKENAQREMLLRAAQEANGQLTKALRESIASEPPRPIPEPEKPPKPAAKPEEDALWDQINYRISNGPRPDRIKQLEVLCDELRKNLSAEETQQVLTSALEHQGLHTLDDLNSLMKGRRVARELYETVKTLAAKGATA